MFPAQGYAVELTNMCWFQVVYQARIALMVYCRQRYDFDHFISIPSHVCVHV